MWATVGATSSELRLTADRLGKGGPSVRARGPPRDRLPQMTSPASDPDPEETSSGLFEAVQGHFEQAAERIGLDDGARKVLSTHRREVAVSVRVSRDDG